MSGVFRDITIEWGGEPFVVTPSSRLLRRIEAEGDLSLAKMMSDMAQGRPSAYAMAFVLFKLLQSAGAKLTEDEMAAALMGADIAEATALSTALATCISPQPIKKSEASNETAAAGAKTKKKTPHRK